jgi:DHA2 family multidrug resistance protein
MGMPLIGYINDKIDSRWLLSMGFIGFGLCSIYFGQVNLNIGPWTLFWPIVITGFALSFVFVPITTQAYGTLSNQQIGNASGIFNLVRNVGGSIGIALAQTLLTRRADVHQTLVAGSVPTTGYWFEQRMNSLTGYLGHATNPANAPAGARNVIYQQLEAQGRLWAFVDIFRWTGLVAFCCVAIVWLFRKVKAGHAPAGAH